MAGGGRGLDHFPQISKLLRDAHILCEPVFTEHKFHATELTVHGRQGGLPPDHRRGRRRDAARGGERAVHPAGGVSRRGARGRWCAVGTGNDWVRTFGISNRYQDAVKAIGEGLLVPAGRRAWCRTRRRTTARAATWPTSPGRGSTRMSCASFRTCKKKGRRSRWRSTWCLVKNFFRYKSTGVQGAGSTTGWSTTTCCCRHRHRHLQVQRRGHASSCPAAVADDGMLDLSLIRPVHFWHLLFRFHYLFNGGIYRIRHILQERGSRIRIESVARGVGRDRRRAAGPYAARILDSPPGHPHRRGPRFLPAVRRRRGGDPGRVARSRKREDRTHFGSGLFWLESSGVCAHTCYFRKFCIALPM